MDISSDLLKFNEHKLPENFVAIAVAIENKKPFHAAILIRHKNKDYLYHYPGNTPPLVEEDYNVENLYIYKVLDAFSINDESEIGSFLQYCKRICEKCDITYSYIIDGSGYDPNGEFISKEGLPELGSCVGFCINTLKNAIIDIETSMFELGEWDDSEIEIKYDNYAQSQARNKYPELNWELYNAFKKRITPLEYLCSSFINTYPIKKAQIEQIKNEVLADIQTKF